MNWCGLKTLKNIVFAINLFYKFALLYIMGKIWVGDVLYKSLRDLKNEKYLIQ